MERAIFAPLRRGDYINLEAMFLRFTKGSRLRLLDNKLQARQYLKAVLLEDKLLMEYGDVIVGVAKLHEENERCLDWDIVVATKCSLGGERVARAMKDIIGRSNKFSQNPSTKRRKYYVEEFEMAFIPIKASLSFTSL